MRIQSWRRRSTLVLISPRFLAVPSTLKGFNNLPAACWIPTLRRGSWYQKPKESFSVCFGVHARTCSMLSVHLPTPHGEMLYSRTGSILKGRCWWSSLQRSPWRGTVELFWKTGFVVNIWLLPLQTHFIALWDSWSSTSCRACCFSWSVPTSAPALTPACTRAHSLYNVTKQPRHQSQQLWAKRF